MLDYVRQRPSPTISLKSRLIILFFMFFNLFSFCLHGIETKSVVNPSLQTIFQLKHAQLTNQQQQQQQQQRKSLRIIYYREFDMTIDENRLKSDIKNLTISYGIDFKLNVLDQSKSLSITKLCSLISEERRDTILIADLYTKEIDLISRSLKLPTIAITNRYQIVQGKLHNPYLFKLMPDAVEEAKSTAYFLDTRTVYTRIALLYDTSLDMTEYRLSYLRLAKQHIVYRAQLPRVSVSQGFRRTARTIIYDLTQSNVDVILCIMSTERELQFVRLIKELGSLSISQLLLNGTSWWFVSQLGEVQSFNYFPKVFTASEDRRQMLNFFSSTSIKILLEAVLRTYMRLPNISTVSSLFIGPPNCATQLNARQLQKTDMFVKLFANFTEWNCEIRFGTGVEPILFDPKTLSWRVPTMFMLHHEHTCRGMLTRTFYPINMNAEQFFRSCRPISYSSRKSLSSQQDNSTSPILSNAIVDITNYYKTLAILRGGLRNECRFVQFHTLVPPAIVVGVVEPPYIFVSDAQISSEFQCNNGIPCYQIDPPLPNKSIDALFFHSKMIFAPHCCYGISIALLSSMEDTNSILQLKTITLFVFSDKPNKWLALTDTLRNRRARLSISPIPIESYLAQSIELSPPFYHSSYVLLTAPKTAGPSIGAFLQPFAWTTWCMIFLILNAAALFETFFEWHSPYGLTPKGRRRQKVFSLASALTLSWSIIFSHTFKTKSPKCWSNRFLGNVWGGFGIVFIAIYTAKLAAFMVETPKTETAISVQGIEDECRKMPRCIVGVVANTSDEEYLKRFFTFTLYKHKQYVSSYTEGIDLLNHSITYLLMDHSMARYFLTRDASKSIRISGDNFGSFGLSLGFSKFDTDLKDNINHILLSYVEKGIIQRLHDPWYVYENCENKRMPENGQLSVDRFIGVFILLASGMIVGLIILSIEWLTFKYAVPYWREKQWPGWMFCSQRLYAALNASDEVFNEAYRTSKTHSFRSVGERLHNYSTRSDSLDLRVVDVPKLLCTTYQLKEKMDRINEQQQIQLLPPNGNLRCISSRKESCEEQDIIRIRIDELEQELNRLKLQLIAHSTSDTT